jgi:hypothetical protein
MVRTVMLTAASFMVAMTLLTPGVAVAQASGEDFVVGSGATGGAIPIADIVIDAHSDPSGGNPVGTVSFTGGGPTGIHIDGPVTCLVVTGNQAVITFDTSNFGFGRIEVVDNGSGGATLDTFFVDAFQTPNCSPTHFLTSGGPFVAGDITVHDALPLTSADQCRHGGWRDYADDQGVPFKNQGNCLSFARHAA